VSRGDQTKSAKSRKTKQPNSGPGREKAGKPEADQGPGRRSAKEKKEEKRGERKEKEGKNGT
jgi:hypothetical protein